MLDRLMEKLIESTATAYMPKIEEMAEQRKAELIDIRANVRTKPDRVEAWFDREIEKVCQVDLKNLLGKLT